MRKMNLKIKSVIFDMDGVITNTMPDHYRAWRQTLKEEGVKVNYLDIYSREGQRGINSVEELFAKYGVPYNERDAKRILRKKENLFKKIVKKRFITGSRSFIKRLHRENFQLALVTGTSRHETHRILPGNLYDCFDVVVTGCDVKNGKPHPEPFKKAIKGLKIRAKDGIVIENAPFGIQAACKAGLSCLALETSLPKKFLKGAGATAVYPSIKELSEKVKFVLN